MKAACSQGNFPVAFTIWGIALEKKVDLMVPDEEGNTPIHFAALADNAEVVSYTYLTLKTSSSSSSS